MSALADERPGFGARVLRVLGTRGLITWAVLIAAVLSLIAALMNSVKGLELWNLSSVALAAVTVGWLVGLFGMRAWIALPLGVLLGVEYLLVRVGHLWDEIWQMLRSIGQFLWELLVWSYYPSAMPDWERVPEQAIALWTDMLLLLRRAYGWLVAVFAGTAQADPVGSALTWGLITWLCAYWAGWMVRRHSRPLIAILPGGILISFALSYTNSSPYSLLPLAGTTLVLMAIVRQRDRESRWSGAGIDFSQALWVDVAAVATGVALALVLAAAVSPSLSFYKIADWIEEVTRGEDDGRSEAVAESLGLEQKPVYRPPTPLELVQTTGLPRRHLLGSGPELSRQMVMVVSTGDLPSIPDPTVMDLIVPHYYWRSVTYDNYFGRGWSTSGTSTSAYVAGERAVWPNVLNQRMMRQTVRLIGDVGGLVHVQGTLVAVDQPYEIAWRPPGEVFAATSEAREYRADSLVPVFTEEQLRAAEPAYPDWIAERYLALPDSVPARVRNLALELTATETTAYDRALAIERYLRTFPYTLDVAAPPTNVDIADFFLFELKTGYCDYYATSMVVLARAAGLPARLVVGYASGAYDMAAARYVVTEADAHAWVEVYFDGYGWIEFEPTAGRPAIERGAPDEALKLPDARDLEPLMAPSEEEQKGLLVGTLLLSIAGVLAVLLLLTEGLDAVLLLTVGTSEAMVGKLYRRLKRQAERLDVAVRTGYTPHEVQGALNSRLDTIAHQRASMEAVVADAKDALAEFTNLLVDTWYAPRTGSPPMRRPAILALWWSLRWNLAAARLGRRPRRERPPMPTSPPPVPQDLMPPPQHVIQ